MSSNVFGDMPSSFEEGLENLRKRPAEPVKVPEAPRPQTQVPQPVQPAQGGGSASEPVEQVKSEESRAETAAVEDQPAEPVASESAVQEQAVPETMEVAPVSTALTMARRNAAAAAADEVDEEAGQREGETRLKDFPNSLVEELRTRLQMAGMAPTKNNSGPFAQTRVVVGYLVATLGLSEDDLDEETKKVVLAFRKGDPVLTMLHEIANAMNKQSDLLRVLTSTAQVSKATLDVTELSLAYLLAERTGLLDTTHVQPSTMNMTQKMVLQARQQAQLEHRKLKQREDVEKGRPFK